MFAVLAWFCWDFIERAKTKIERDRSRRPVAIVIYKRVGSA